MCENLLWGIINSVIADIVIVTYDIVVVICRISHNVGIGGGVITPQFTWVWLILNNFG